MNENMRILLKVAVPAQMQLQLACNIDYTVTTPPLRGKEVDAENCEWYFMIHTRVRLYINLIGFIIQFINLRIYVL